MRNPYPVGPVQLGGDRDEITNACAFKLERQRNPPNSGLGSTIREHHYSFVHLIFSFFQGRISNSVFIFTLFLLYLFFYSHAS